MKLALPDISGATTIYSLLLGMFIAGLAFIANMLINKNLTDKNVRTALKVGVGVVAVVLFYVGIVVIRNSGSNDKPCSVNQTSTTDYSPNVNNCGSGKNEVIINSGQSSPAATPNAKETAK